MELRAENIGFRYGAKGREIWRNYNISIKSGERLGLMAPSGYGKTTLLKLLAGYERPDEGSVFLDGKPLSEYGGYCPVQLIWQHPEEALNPRLKMKHALKQGGGVSPRIAEGLGIQDEWLERYPSELSGGEMQRFCIARALGEQTKFLLADEITSGKGGMTVSFAETSSLVSGPPETQNPDFFVYDSHQLVRTILDSVQHTLQYNFVDPSLGDPSSLDIYFNLDGEAIVIPDSGETIDPYAPYEPQTEG